MKFTELIKGKTAVFEEFHSGNLFYKIDDNFRFPVPVDELHGAKVSSREKASVFMKWIKRAYNDINPPTHR